MSKPTILCIHDDHNALLTLRTQLMRDFPDYEIQVADSLTEAMALLDERRSPATEIHPKPEIHPKTRQRQLPKQLSDLRFALNAAAIVAITDAQGRITDVNDRFCAISQYTKEELIGQTHQLINADYHTPAFCQDLWRTISSGYVWKGEIKNCAKDGSEYWVDTVIVPFLDNQGQPFQYMAIQFEITERKLAEAALIEAQRIAHIGNWSFDVQTQQITWSVELYRMFGLDSTQPAPSYSEYILRIHPDDAPTLAHCIEQASQNGTPYVIDYRAILPDGSLRYHEGRGEAVRNAQGQVVKLQGTAMDITDRKQAEILIQQSQARLEVAQRIAHLGHWEFDLMTQKITWSEELFHIYGLDSTQPEPTFEAFQQMIHPDDWPMLEANIQSAITQGIPYELEHRIIHTDGSVHYTLGKGETVFSPQGHAIKLVGTGHDTTAAKLAEIALRESEAQNRAILSAIPDLMMVISADGQFLRYSDNEFLGEMIPLHENPVGLYLADLLPIERAEQWRVAIQEVLSTGEIQTFEQQIRLADHIRYEEVRVVPYQTDKVLSMVRNVTERRTAEIQLQEREAQLQAIASNIPGGVFRLIYHVDGRLSAPFVSEGYRTLFGIDPAVLKANPSFTLEMVHPDDRAIDSEAAANAITGQTNHVQREVRYQLPTGEVKWISTTAQLQREANGDVVVDGIDIDITARKATEDALRQSEAMHRALLNALPDLILRVNREGIYLDFVATDIFNVIGHAEDWVGTRVDESLPPELAERRMNAVLKTLETREMQIYEQEIWIDGAVQTEECRVVICEPDHVLIVVRDISDRKRNEVERRQAEIALQRSEEQLRLALEFGKIAICDWDITNDKLALNDNFYQLMGFFPNSGERTYDDWFQALHPDDQEPTHQEIKRALAERRDISLEYRVVWADGTHHWLADRGRGVYDAVGNPVRVISIALDITDRKLSELAFRKLVEGTASAADNDFFPQLVQSLVEVLGIAHAMVSEVWDGQFQTLAFLSEGNVVPNITYSLEDKTACALVIENGEYICPQGLRQEFPDNPYLEGLLAESYIGVALKSQTGLIIGHLCIIDNKPILKADWFASILKIFAARAAVELERQRAKAELQQLNQDLEQRVQQRTQELARSEQDLRTIFNNVYDAIFIHDLDGTILDINDRALQLFDADQYQILSTTIPDLSAPDAPLERLPQILQQVQSGETIQMEWKSRRLEDQTPFDSEISLRRVTLGNREVFIAGVRDISDRKRVEAALQQSEQDLRTIFNNVYDAIFIHDLDGKNLDFNTRALELYAATREQLQSATIFDLSPRDMPLDEAYHLLQRARNGETVRFEWKDQRWHDHSTFDVEVSLQRVTLGNRSVLLSGVRDISDRKQAEEALRQKEEQYRTIFEAVSDGLFITDLDTGKQLEINPAACQMHGYTYAEFLQLSPSDFIHSDSLPTYKAFIEALRAGHRFLGQGIDIRKNGQTFDVEVTGTQFSYQGRPCSLSLVRDISARKQQEAEHKLAEAKLKQQEQLLRSMYEGVEHSICLVDVVTPEGAADPHEFRFLGWNKATEKKTGIPSATIVGKNPEELLGDTQGAMIRHNYQRCIEAGVSITYEELLPFQGRDIWWLTTLHPLKDPEGTIYRIVITMFEISDRKQAEAALIESEAKFRRLVEGANHLVYAIAPDQTFTYLSPQFTTRWGYEVADFLGQTFIDLVHPDDLPLLLAANRRLYETGEPQAGLEFRTRSKDGSWVWILCSDSPIKDAHGHVIGVQGIAQDISDRKTAEQALQDSEEKLQLAAEAAEIGVWYWNLLTNIEIWSPQAYELFGLTPETFDGYTETLYARIHPDDLAKVRQLHCEALETGDYQAEYRVMHPNGGERWISSRGKVFFDTVGTPLRMTGVSVDISDRKRVEQQLRQINTELEQRVEERTQDLQQAMQAAEAATRSKSIFLANMSHELRTPLNAILGFSQLLNRDADLSEQQQERVSIINRSGGHLLSLINDILEISKIEAGRVILTPSNFDLYLLLKSLEEVFYLQATAQGLRLSIQASTDTPQYIQADESKLRQVLTNLLHNAIKFTQQGQVRLVVQIAHDHLNASNDPKQFHSALLSFSVMDMGPGIDITEQSQLFEPFVQTTAGHQSQQGTGLGLFISQQFVQLMGGQLTVQSVLGQGTTFAFQIPVIPVHQQSLMLPVQQCNVIGLAPNQPHYRILIAEDHPENRKFLTQLFQSVGFDVQQAENGQDALQCWQQWQPDLIWMDLRMPVLDGYEVTRHIRALSSSATSPKILAFTANTFVEDECLTVFAAGFDDWVGKPVTETILFEKMAEHLGVRYLYSAPSTSSTAYNSDDVSTIELSAHTFKDIPIEWIEQLQWAARIADQELLLELLEQLPPNQVLLAQALRTLIEYLRLDKLIELTNAVISQHDQSTPPGTIA